ESKRKEQRRRREERERRVIILVEVCIRFSHPMGRGMGKSKGKGMGIGMGIGLGLDMGLGSALDRLPGLCRDVRNVHRYPDEDRAPVESIDKVASAIANDKDIKKNKHTQT